MTMIQPPTDETVLATVAAHGATVTVNETQSAYVLTRADGSTVEVPFGAALEEWAAQASVPAVASTPAG